MLPTPKLTEILLVEDNSTDIIITREALEHSRVPSNLHVVSNGVEALAFLRREGDHNDVPRPELILLDLNLPRKNGCEVLAEIKADPMLRAIPVIVLSTSKSKDDILKTYDLHANCYVVKPVDFKSFTEMICSIHEFWFGIVTPPFSAI